MERIRARYWIETPFSLEKAAAALAGEQSSGTFVKVVGESEELTRNHAAKVERIEELEAVGAPSLPVSQTLGFEPSSYQRAFVSLSWPIENVGYNLQNVMATVAGNLFELAQFTGLRLLDLELPDGFAKRYRGPRFGVEGTRRLVSVSQRPLIGTIIKPSVGMTPEQTGKRVAELVAAGLDFLKDDELMGDPPHSPFEKRVDAVMASINELAQKQGRKAMYAFNVSGSIDDMLRRHDYVVSRGGSCIMASMNWVGMSGIENLATHSEVPIHGHRNGWGLFYRSPFLGVSYTVMQTIWRLLGVDHLHCNGLRNKFCESDASVVASAKACLEPMGGQADRALPVISSGQWAGQAADTLAAIGSPDLLYVCGGGIVGHPQGLEAGVNSVRFAWDAALSGTPLEEAMFSSPELKQAVEFFGKR